MCGIIVALSSQRPNPHFVQRRGPDYFGRCSRGAFEFFHYLLHITGSVFRQPLIDDDVICLFNGEIYNHPFEKSDGEVIIPLYRQYGQTFARHLDGEYAIALYDFSREIVLFVTDPFATKPLWVNGAQCASYASALGGHRLAPNTTLVRTFSGETLRSLPNAVFDFDGQDKDDFSDWIDAFRVALRKRARDGCYVGVSSGYDSGAIACELRQQGVEFGAYSVLGNEDIEVLLARQKLLGARVLDVDSETCEREREFLKTSCEHYNYRQETGLDLHWPEMIDDPGAIGASLIHRKAKADGRRVFLSGQGADEILADYSLTPSLSHFHGVFPTQLRPWPNFFGGCQRAYLTKEEFVAGSHGIEGRYPFLDPALVQEFLWLTPRAKNRFYKGPLREYLLKHQFPFKENIKVGFGLPTISPARSQ